MVVSCLTKVSKHVARATSVGHRYFGTFSTYGTTLKRKGRRAEQVVRVERVNVAAGGQAIVGTVTPPSMARGSPENQDQPYGTEYERTGEPEAGTAVWGQEAGRLAVPEAES